MLALKLFQTQRTLIRKCYLFDHYKISPFLRKINTSGSICMASKSEAVHRPNQIDKYMLVWTKKYPSVAEVPRTVSITVMEKMKNKVRIKLTIYLMVLTAVVCVGMIYSGKQASKRGESVRKMNVDWHKEQDDKK